MFKILSGITILLYAISFLKNKKKTKKAVMIAFKKLKNISGSFLLMLILISFALFFVPQDLISKYLNSSNIYANTIIAAGIGSISMMPGFIAFPLAGILKEQGVNFMVLSAFTSTLMMVGLLTIPYEKEHFGLKITILRNIISFVISIIVAIATGFFYGELF